MKWSRFPILFIAAALPAGLALPAGPAWPAAPGAELTIRVENVLADGGVLRLGLYDAAGYPPDNAAPIASADVPAIRGETIVTLHGVPPGVYAIETFQDVNANGAMDTSWLGVPLEPFGFSRDATPFLSKPSFDAVKFTLAAGENAQTIHLQNSVKGSPTDKARDSVRARQHK